MHSVYFTPEHQEFRRQVSRLMETEVAPRADDWEAAGRIDRAIWRRMGELGFLGITFEEAYGGSEADLFFAMAFLEELPRSRLGGFCAAVSVQQFMATQHIYKFGSQELKERYLTPSIQGRKVGALAITEPDTGSDVAAIRTRAEKRGDQWVINGAKTFITNGADGDFLTVACKTDPKAGVGGVSLIVVDHDTPGLTVTKRLKKMGWHCGDTAELSFEDVSVPEANLVGQENQGFYYIMEAFQLERLTGAAIGVGSAAMCLEETLPYLNQRTTFGKPLSSYQALTHRLADLAAEVEASRQLTYHAAWLMQNGHNCVAECTMAKLHASELAVRVADACLQCFGGYGFMEEYPMARFYRDVRVGTIVAGTSEIMREILARLMTEAGAQAHPARSAPGEPLPQSTSGQASAEDAPPAAEPTVSELFESLPRRFRPEKAEGISAVFHFELAGDEPGEWTVRMADGACQVEPGHAGDPDCLVQMDQDTYLGIETGRLNPQTAFMGGKIKVSDIGKMMTFIQAFRPLGK